MPPRMPYHYNRIKTHVRYSTSLQRGRKSLFLLTAVVAAVTVFVATRLLNQKPLHVFVRFSGHEREIKDGFRLIIENDDAADDNLEAADIRLTSMKALKKLSSSNSTLLLSSLRDNFTLKARASRWKLNPVSKCKKSSPELLILIASHESSSTNRDVIRRTWCKKKSFSNGRTVICLFLIGQTEGQEGTPTSILKEYAKYRDLLKMEFPDNFRNSSRKLLMGLEWMNKHCPDARFFMKTEDDVIMNTDVTMEKMIKDKTPKDLFMGRCWSDSPNRNPKSRFYVSRVQYPEDKYPVYCSGTGYIMSGDVSRRLHAASKNQILLPLDDVFAGVLLNQINVSPENIPGFLIGRFDETTNCSEISSAATIHAHGLDLEDAWDTMKEICR